MMGRICPPVIVSQLALHKGQVTGLHQMMVPMQGKRIAPLMRVGLGERHLFAIGDDALYRYDLL